jgi:acyl-coenzyme A thioesterase PaaI-like protein
VIAGGRRVAFVEASITARTPGEGADERLVARATSTYIYKDRD